MFKFLVDRGTSMRDLSMLHPEGLEALLELGWANRMNDPANTFTTGHPRRRSDVPGRFNRGLPVPAVLNGTRPRILPFTGTIPLQTIAEDVATFTAPAEVQQGLIGKHCIYAYMIENTRIVEVFRRVLDNFLHGERLAVLSAPSQRWLWTTEELFFRDPPPFSITTQTSSVRPALRPTRDNLHQRLFGMTLNPTLDNPKPAFAIAEHANVDFVTLLDELLHEIWQGRTNFANQVGARPTDDAKIAQLCDRLGDMLRSRRTNGTLSREEYWAVSTMSWFHATVLDPTHDIVRDLKAEAPSAEECLFKIAQRVGYPAHGLSKSYFEVAEPLSRLLTAIETGIYSEASTVPALYTPPTVPPPPGVIAPVDDTDKIKTHWSIIRGRDIKAKKVAAT
jgi:hypothetical protein